MKKALQATAAIALAVGLAASAQAGTYKQDAAQPQTTNRHAAAMHTERQATVTKADIRQAQQQLKSDGLFKGRVDGRMTPQLKVAISRFQQQNGLKRTGRLDQNTLAQLGGGGAPTGATGVGSSMPAQSGTATPPPLSGAGNGVESTAPAKIGSPKQP